jgi:pyruvate-formate lyase-activating enzyme
MGWLDLIKGLFDPIGGKDAEFVYVQCDRCAEPLKARIDLTHELSADFTSKGSLKGYFTHKTLMGEGPCFQQIDVEVRYDQRRRRQGITVSGGESLSQADFQALASEQAEQPTPG